MDASSFSVAAPEQHPEEGYVGNLNVIDVESELCSPVRKLPGLGDLGRMRSLDDKMADLGTEFSSLGKSYGEFGSFELSFSKGHPGIGEIPGRGHPGLGMPLPSNDIQMDEPGIIRVKTVGVLEAPSLSGDQSRPLALAMPLGSVPGHGEDPTMLYRHEVANRGENVADGMSEREAQREMSELEFALQNLNPSEVEHRRKLFHQQQYR